MEREGCIRRKSGSRLREFWPMPESTGRGIVFLEWTAVSCKDLCKHAWWQARMEFCADATKDGGRTVVEGWEGLLIVDGAARALN